MSDNWDVYFTSIQENFASVVLDLDIWNEIDQTEFSKLVGMRIEIINPSEGGGPIGEESELLNDLEDSLIVAIEGVGHNVGRITTAGIRDTFFYFNQSIDLQSAAEAIFAQHGYEVETFEIEEEEPWAFYTNTLYPTKYELHHMSNRKILSTLAESGDTLEEPRQIDHWIFFKNTEDASSFVNKVNTLNFTAEVNTNKDNDIIVHLYRVEPIESDLINELTDTLIELAEQCNGEYDGWETMVIR